MLDAIAKLIVLQECDHQILQLRNELTNLEPQRQRLHSKLSSAQHGLETAKEKLKHLESERKSLELEVEEKKKLIEKYSLQQFQTKKNEEYRALNHEIDLCKQNIVKLEDRQLELMEQAETVQQTCAAAKKETDEAAQLVNARVGELATHEAALKQRLADLEGQRAPMTEAVEATFLARYERLRKHKGEKILVGIDRGICAGCHMRVPPQVLLSCQAQQDLVSCPNCGRMLYYSPEMDLAVSDES